jgi:hypothetical protein
VSVGRISTLAARTTEMRQAPEHIDGFIWRSKQNPIAFLNRRGMPFVYRPEPPTTKPTATIAEIVTDQQVEAARRALGLK